MPFFRNPNALTRIIPKPSGNFVRLRCVAGGMKWKFLLAHLAHECVKFTLKLYVILLGKPEPNITWTKDGGEINRIVGKVLFQKWAIVLEDLTPRDSGTYTCTVCNINGCIEHKTTLKVQG